MNLNDVRFERPEELGVTKIQTNQGLLILFNPCAFDFDKLQEISGKHPRVSKFLYMAEYLGDTIDGLPVTMPTLMKLDPSSLQKLVSHFSELMLSIVPMLSPESQKLLDQM